jgi:decaprenylphospho-beta-D-erythro-pentofuranosid-2-ulose 2-reductase
MANILIIGATSAIAKATARCYANRGDSLYLLARNKERLEDLAQDLKVRGAKKVFSQVLDVNNVDEHASLLQQSFEKFTRIDVVLIAHGTLPSQAHCEQDVSLMLQEIHTNGVSTLALLTQISIRLAAQKSGTLAVITSVAGDRGRQSNYVYGAAKRMVSTFLQGLRNRLHKDGVNVLDIKPGFVDSPMTKNFPKGMLWAQPETIAKLIIHGIDTKKTTLYAPNFWRYIMWIICIIPEVIFRKLSL